MSNNVKCSVVVCLVLLLICVTSSCLGWSGTCVKASDGDTIKVTNSVLSQMIFGKEKPISIRIDGINSPEHGQDFYMDAIDYMKTLVLDKTVEITLIDMDSYGLVVARVKINGKDVGEEMMKAGLSFWFRKYNPKDETLARLESEARKAKKGMWPTENNTSTET